MKTIRLYLLALLGVLLLSTARADAQAYDLAGGVRFGYPNSLSLKKSIGELSVLEATLGHRGSFLFYNRFNVGLAYQRLNPLDDVVEGLHWYWGAGGTVYFYNFNSGFGNDLNSIGFGAQGFVGLEYNFEDIPLNLTLDWVPTIVLGDDYFNRFQADTGGLGIRYIFGY